MLETGSKYPLTMLEIGFLVVRVFGLLRTAQIGQGWQMCCVIAALLAFLSKNTMLLLVTIALSRIGLWWFDLSLRQMIQKAVPEHVLAPLFATEGSAQQCAQLVMLLLVSVAFPQLSQYVIPVVISASMVVLAGIVLNIGVRFKSADANLESSTLLTNQGIDSATLLPDQNVELSRYADSHIDSAVI